MSTEILPAFQAEASPPAIAGPDVLAAFLSGRKPTTVRAYASDLAHFARCCSGGWRSVADELDHFFSLTGGGANALVLTYRNAMEFQGLASATINRRLAALRSVTKLARTLGRVAWSVEIEGLKPERRRDVRGPDKDDRKKLWKALRFSGNNARARRDRAMVALLFGLALRRGEVVSLDLGDVDFASSTVRVLRKGKREKTSLSIPDKVEKALGEWVLVRGPAPGPLFTRTDRPGSSERLTGEGLARAVARLGRLAKLDRKLRPHGFRHSAITKLRSGGETDRNVAGFSGHLKTENLDRYDDSRDQSQARLARDVSAELW